MTQIGLMFEGQDGMTWERWRRLLDAAETFGYQCVFRSDHFTIRPPYQESLETWTSLTYAAAQPQHIEFGPLVTPITFRHPSIIVRMAAAVDDLSSGRHVLGIGMGWNEHEHRQFGVPFYDIPTRFAMLRDGLEIITGLLRQPEPVTHMGKHFSVEGAVLLPRPKRAGGPPVMIGGNGPKLTLPLVAQYADEWNGVFIPPERYRERNLHLNDLLQQRGRSLSSLKRSLMTELIFAENDAAMKAKLAAHPEIAKRVVEGNRIAGTPSEIVDRIGKYVEAGVQRFMLQCTDLDDIDGLEKMAHSVLPHFHKK